MRIDRRTLRIRLLALVPLLFLTSLFIAGVYDAYCHYLVRYDSAVGTAILTDEYWGGQALYNYRYVVDGKEYRGLSRMDYPSQKYGDVSTGDMVPVYYSVDHPSVSFLYVPDAVVEGLPLILAVFVLWVVFLITVIHPDSVGATNGDGNGAAK